MSSLTGKVALVTGASMGIGAAIARRLAADGASVVVNHSKSADKAAGIVNAIEADGGTAAAIRADVSKPAEIKALIEATFERFGSLDILVNNAALYRGDSLDTITPESFDEHYALNVRSLLLTTQAAARVLPEGGVIVNISSGVAKSPYPVMHVYCSTKAAVDTLTRSLAIELGPRKIRVVGVAPGFTSTDGNAQTPQAMVDVLVAKTPLRRPGLPTDIAAFVAYAVSEDAGWITGVTIDVAGGMVF